MPADTTNEQNVPLRFKWPKGGNGCYFPDGDYYVEEHDRANTYAGKPTGVTWLDGPESEAGKVNVDPEFTAEELAVLKQLSEQQELTTAQVLRQALRTYQSIVTGHCKLIWPPNGKAFVKSGSEVPLTYEQRSHYCCKVCGNVPDEEGRLEHGKGCYTQSSDGGGESYVEFDEPNPPAAPPVPSVPLTTREEIEASQMVCNEATQPEWRTHYSKGALMPYTVQAHRGDGSKTLMLSDGIQSRLDCDFCSHAREELPHRNSQMLVAMSKIAELERELVITKGMLEAGAKLVESDDTSNQPAPLSAVQFGNLDFGIWTKNPDGSAKENIADVHVYAKHCDNPKEFVESLVGGRGVVLDHVAELEDMVTAAEERANERDRRIFELERREQRYREMLKDCFVPRPRHGDQYIKWNDDSIDVALLQPATEKTGGDKS